MPTTPTITLPRIDHFLRGHLHSERFPQDPGGILHDIGQPVRRLGMALEPSPNLETWVAEHKIDALFLHRAAAWQDARPAEMGIISYHAPFDAKFTLGYNVRLAAVLGMSTLEVLGYKNGRPLGMIGDVESQTVVDFFRKVNGVFGGSDETGTCERDEVCRVAVVNGMTKQLVHEASERGADVYVTGQYRQPGRIGVLETGIGVVIVGHSRSEEWGLRALANLLRERFCSLDVVVHSGKSGK